MKSQKHTGIMIQIPVNEPIISDLAREYAIDAIDSGWISSAGSYVDRFEKAFAEFLGVKHAITVTNGTAALHLALASIDIGPGDEVILPSFTMVSCLNSILYTGATPVFVDVDPDTYCLNPEQVSAKVTDKTKAIMVVHIYGHSADLDPILELGERENIAVIEDAAEALGASYKGVLCGTMGQAGCFSFYGNKLLTTGEGGMVVTNDPKLAERARSLKDLAHHPKRRFWHEEVGFNYRLTNIQAALGLGQLSSVEEFIRHKEWMAAAYHQRLEGLPLRLPISMGYAKNVNWMYAVLVQENSPLSRDELRKVLLERGIDTREFFYPLSNMKFAKRYAQGHSYPVSEMISQSGLYLPSGLTLTDNEHQTICSTLYDLLC